MRYGKSLKNAAVHPIGGMNVDMFPNEFEVLPKDTVCFTFAIHDIIPPQGIQIRDKNKKIAEEIPLSVFSTDLKVKAIDIMYSVALIHELEKHFKTATPENRFRYRERINEICLENNI